jgi:hypothetical protein
LAYKLGLFVQEAGSTIEFRNAAGIIESTIQQGEGTTT